MRLAQKTVADAPDVLDQVVNHSGAVKTDISTGAGEVIQFALLLVGIAFFVLMIYAGMRWMLSRGNEESVTKARKTLTGAIIGLIIVVAAYALTTFLVGRLVSGVPQGAGGAAPGEFGGGTGTEPLGCCLEQYQKAADPGSGDLTVGPPLWKASITTEATCIANAFNSEGDKLFGPGTYEWDGTKTKSVECSEALLKKQKE